MSESLFTSQTPNNPDNADGNTIVTATVVRFASAGTVGGIRWYGPTSTGVAAIGGLFTITGESTGAELARATFGTITGGAWNTVAFTSPVDVAAVTDYVAAVWCDHYVSSGNFFGSALTNGNVTGPADGDPLHNGRFLFPAPDLAFPPSNFNKSCYFVDVLFDETVTQIPATLDATGPAATAEMSAGVTGLLGAGAGHTASLSGSAGPPSAAAILGAIT